MSTNLPPERLIEEARGFSQDAWAQIFDQHYARMFDYCYLRTGDRSAAEDLASDVFLQALRGIRGYRYRGAPFSAWLYAIARNVSADFIRQRAHRPVMPLLVNGTSPQLAVPDGAEAAARNHDIQSALRQLTDDQQQVIILRFFHGLSHEETAAAMRKRSGAVRVLQSRALQALRRVMTAGMEGQRI
jgi:RNA polymerase sigma-70 factor (ECF subfamily)